MMSSTSGGLSPGRRTGAGQIDSAPEENFRDAETVLAEVFREQWGRIVATLIGATGDWDLAEESAQDALARALRAWPRDGIPQRPGAWLTTAARRTEAADAYRDALGLAPTASERRYLESRLAEVSR